MTEAQHTTACYVKWFDQKKGFGFLVPEEGGQDILLHANVLRQVGRNSIADDVRLDVVVTNFNGRLQAAAIVAIHTNSEDTLPRLAQLVDLDPEEVQALPPQPARVKWFDPAKGIGFANVFGSSEDVFIHIGILKAAGLASLEPGEAIILRVLKGDRGFMAAEVMDWDFE